VARLWLAHEVVHGLAAALAMADEAVVAVAAALERVLGLAEAPVGRATSKHRHEAVLLARALRARSREPFAKLCVPSCISERLVRAGGAACSWCWYTFDA